jgi:hypothetical protein
LQQSDHSIKEGKSEQNTKDIEASMSDSGASAALSVPIEANIAVIQVPILFPKIIPAAALKFKRPASDKDMTRPVVAEEDWTVAVIKAPKPIDISGFDV